MFKNLLKTKNLKLKIDKRKLLSFIGSLLLLVIVSGLGFKWLSNPAQAGWFDDNWTYRKKVTVGNTGSADASKKVKFDIDTAALVTTGSIQSDCDDARFTDANGKLLRYFLDTAGGACNTSSTDFYVLVEVINSGNTNLYFYYGNPAASIGSEAVQFSESTFSPTSGPTFASEEKGTGPIRFWIFDEGYGTTTNDAGMGNFDGTLQGDTHWRTEDMCVTGKCLFLDGTGDYVSTSARVGPQSGMTFETWVKPTTVSGTQIIMSQVQAGPQYYMQFIASGSTLLFRIHASDGNNFIGRSTASTLTANTWQHVVGTWDGGTTSASVKIYKNGLRIDTADSQLGTFSAANANSIAFEIGSQAGGTLLTGFVDDVKEYNYARSANQIKTDYVAGLSGQSPSEGMSAGLGGNRDQVNQFLSNGLVGYWKLDESSGNATDSSENGLTLTNNGTTTFVTGKFANGSEHVPASSQYLSTATTISGVKSVSFWTNPDSTTNYFISLTSSAYITASSGTISATGFTSPQIFVNGTQTTTIAADSWQLVTVTTDTAINADTFYVGRQGSNYYDGTMDEVRLYHRAISPAEITSLYNWAPGPVGYWKMDDNTGTSAVDSSGNGGTGTLNSDANYRPGKYGSGVYFDGGNDDVNIPDADRYSPTNTNAFTVTAWVRADVVNVAQQPVSKNAGSGNQEWVIALTSSGTAGYLVYNTAVGGFLSAFSTDVLTAGQWYHMAFTVNLSDNTSFFYLNGIQVASDSSTTGTLHSNGTAAVKFGESADNGNDMTGMVDEVKIYSYVRSTKQITEDMNAGHPAGGSPIASSIIHWKLDEGNGTIANNSGSDASLDGTTNSVAWQAPDALVTTCKVNGCARLNTTTDFVSAGDTAFTDSLTQMTLSLWLTPSAPTINDDIVGKSNFSNQNSFHVITDATNADEIRVYIASTTSDISNYFLTSNFDLTGSTQQHLAIVYDGSQAASSRVKVFKNGVPVAGSVVGTIPAALTSGSTSNLKIGDTDVTGLQLIIGYYDEFKIYTSALTASEIGVDMSAGSSAAMGGVLGLHNNEGYGEQVWDGGIWNFNENTGTTSIADTAGNDFTMTMNNFEATDWVVGKYGSALDFDGSAEYLNHANDILPQSNYTFSAWVKPDNTNTGTIYMQGTTSADFPYTEITYESGAIVFRSANDAGTVQNAAAASTGTLVVGQWNFIAVVKASTTVTYMVNGIINLTSIANAGTYANMTHSSIGVLHRSTDTQFFDGAIDQATGIGDILTTPSLWYAYNRGGPFLHYKLDECQGTVANNSSYIGGTIDASFDGTINIGSGGSNTSAGTCSSGTNTEAWNNGTTGKYNFSLDFDGTDDYVETADDNQLDFNDASFSIEAWINRDSFTTDDTVFAKKTNQTTAAGYILYIDDVTDDVNFVSADGVDSFLVNGRTAITATGWVHIVAVFNESGLSATIYVNGIEDKESTTGTLGPVGNMSNSSTLRLGEESDGGEPFDGRIDNFKLYKYPLPTATINKLYNEGVAQRFGPVEGAP